MVENNEKEWRALIESLAAGEQEPPPADVGPHVRRSEKPASAWAT